MDVHRQLTGQPQQKKNYVKVPFIEHADKTPKCQVWFTITSLLHRSPSAL